MDPNHFQILATISECNTPMSALQIMTCIAQKERCPFEELEPLYDELDAAIKASEQLGLIVRNNMGRYLTQEMDALWRIKAKRQSKRNITSKSTPAMPAVRRPFKRQIMSTIKVAERKKSCKAAKSKKIVREAQKSKQTLRKMAT